MLARYLVIEVIRDFPYYVNFMNAVAEKNSCTGS